jgi:phosphoglycerate kinase
MANLEAYRTGKSPLSLETVNLTDKHVLVRVDFNCPVDKGVVTNNYRIRESLKTLNFLKEKGVKKITLVTHFKRPKGEYDPALSLAPIKEELEKLWGEKVDCPPFDADYEKYANLVLSREAQVILWENIRFWPGEKKNDPEFAQALAEGQDIYISEAFSACHREHASVTGVAKLLPAYAGFRVAEEAKENYRLMHEPASPSVAIVGGAKIETKIPVLRALAKDYDQILLGGKIAIEYEDLNNNDDVETQRDSTPEPWMEKIELPTGYLGDEKFDIDEASALKFAEIIKPAKKILWNGPVGKFEEMEFRKGSEIIARAVAENKEAFRLIGGGDTAELLEELGLQNDVGFVSTGGGAMLEYIANDTLPGLEVLQY